MNEFTNFCDVTEVANENDCFPQQATKWKKGIYSTYKVENDPSVAEFETADSAAPAPEKAPKKKKSKKSVKAEPETSTSKTDGKNDSKSKTVPFSVGQKKIIMNVFKYFRTEYYDVNVSEAVRRTSKATGCAERTVYSIRKEEQSEQGLQASKSKRVKRPIWKLKYGDDVRTAIRTVIYDLKARNIVPSIKEIQQHVKTNLNITMARSSLWVLIKEMGFVYIRKKGKEHTLVEKALELDPATKKKLKLAAKLAAANSPATKVKKPKQSKEAPHPQQQQAAPAAPAILQPAQQQQPQPPTAAQPLPPPPTEPPAPQPAVFSNNHGGYQYMKNGSFYDDGYTFP